MTVETENWKQGRFFLKRMKFVFSCWLLVAMWMVSIQKILHVLHLNLRRRNSWGKEQRSNGNVKILSFNTFSNELLDIFVWWIEIPEWNFKRFAEVIHLMRFSSIFYNHRCAYMEYFYKGKNKSDGKVNKTKLLGCVCGNMSEDLIHLIIMYIILCTHTRVRYSRLLLFRWSFMF